MTYWKAMLLTAVGLVAVMAIFELSRIDIWVQDCLYDFQGAHWMLSEDDWLPRAILYTGMKIGAIVIGVACAAGFGLSFRMKRLRSARRGLAVMALSLIFVPLIIGGIKATSNVYTPRQIERYDGKYPYVKPLQRYPAGFVATKRGKGFPAGHATGGLALMGSYFALRRRSARFAGLLVGLAAGWAMGIYQMLVGQHYLSHNVVSTLLAWLIILTINRLLPAEQSQAPVEEGVFAAPAGSSACRSRSQ